MGPYFLNEYSYLNVNAGVLAPLVGAGEKFPESLFSEVKVGLCPLNMLR